MLSQSWGSPRSHPCLLDLPGGLMLRDSALPTVTNVEITALLQHPRGGRTETALKCRVLGP